MARLTLLPYPHLLSPLSQHVYQEDGQIPTTPALPSLQQRQRPAIEQVDGRVPVF